jgi:cysteine desulfurase/selenocysteine lyase
MKTITETSNIALDIERVREEFPILHQDVNGHPLAYFDNAATTQKPQRVLDALNHYYSKDNANIHRGIHTLAERATRDFESTREAVQQFIGAAEREEIIFTYGTTDSINLVAQSYGQAFISAGDEVIISAMEHHSNIVPWQMLCEQSGAILKVIPVNEKGELQMNEYERLLTDRTRIVSVVYASNSLGTINPVEKIIRLAHQNGAVVLLDGAQSTSHLDIDVQALDADFYCFSSSSLLPYRIATHVGPKSL